MASLTVVDLSRSFGRTRRCIEYWEAGQYARQSEVTRGNVSDRLI